MTIRDHIDKAGILGATVAALCCLGVPAILSVLTAIGLGFLINDAILLPLLAVSLVLTLWGLYSGWRRHRHASAMVLGSIASAALVIFTFAHASRPLALTSIALLVIASFINVALLRRNHPAAHQP
jgi:mercuric ion transport protein